MSSEGFGTRVAIFGIGFMMLTFGALVVAWSAQTAWNFQWRLAQGDAERTKARVEDFRTVETNQGRSTTYTLRYVFQVPKQDRDYSFDDDIWIIEQGDGYIDVPRKVWDDSRDTGHIDVEYLKSDPSVNQPVESRRGIVGTIVFGIVGIVMAIIGAMLTFARRRRPPGRAGEAITPS